MTGRIRDRLWGWLHASPLGFGIGLGGATAATGVALGLGPQLLVLGVVLAWVAWEGRAGVWLALGCPERAARVARDLAAGAGECLRGDLHRVTEAAAWLTAGRPEEAKAALALVDPVRLPARMRFAHLVNLSALYCRIGDGEAALAMVEAALGEAEAAALGRSMEGICRVNRAAALSEAGRFEEAVAALGEFDPECLDRWVRPFYWNNLAWALALGGDPARALEPARRARETGGDAAFGGTLGLVLALVGGADREAARLLEGSRAGRARRSPASEALVGAALVGVRERLGERKLAADLAVRLEELPEGRAARERLGRLSLGEGTPGGQTLLASQASISEVK